MVARTRAIALSSQLLGTETAGLQLVCSQLQSEGAARVGLDVTIQTQTLY
jgi:hypothetical protein